MYITGYSWFPFVFNFPNYGLIGYGDTSYFEGWRVITDAIGYAYNYYFYL